MTYSIRRTIRACVAPVHKLSCSRRVWNAGVAELARRGEGRHESGAFVLGHVISGKAEVSRFVYYDDLEQGCLDSGIVRLSGKAFAKLWQICREARLDVVADVHTHGGVGRQSSTDRKNPMMAHPGHIGLILPDFASVPVNLRETGFYIYRGSFNWDDHFGNPAILYTGWWA